MVNPHLKIRRAWFRILAPSMPPRHTSGPTRPQVVMTDSSTPGRGPVNVNPASPRGQSAEPDNRVPGLPRMVNR